MRKVLFSLASFTLAVLLTVGLTWAEEAKSCQKSTISTAVGCEKKCAAEKACAKAEGMSSVDAGHHGHGGEGCHGSGGNRGAKGCHGSGDAKGCGSSEGCHGSGGGHGAKGCQQAGGCHKMMAGRTGHGCAGMHRGMRGRGGRSGWRHERRKGTGFAHFGGPDRLVRMAEHLELTDEQIDDLKTLRRDHEKTAIEMRAEIALARVDMKTLLDQEPIDFGKIKDKISQIADMHKKMGLARWTLMEKSHDLLTTEQLEKARSLRMRGSGSMKEDRRQMIKKMIIEETEE
jgi:Spy/CpxP family protein refolding chaperone